MPRYIKEQEFKHRRMAGRYYALTVELSDAGRYGVWSHTWYRGDIRRQRLIASKTVEVCLARYRREAQIISRHSRPINR